MSQREEIIVEMLKRYTEAQETLTEGIRGDGDGHPKMPGTWNDSYRRLERFLIAMRENAEMRSRWWHVTQRYVDAEVVSMEVPFKKTAKGPIPKLPPHTELVAGAAEVGEFTSRVRIRRWDSKVQEAKVRKAVTLLAEMFEHEPFLPQEFKRAA